VEAKVIKKPVMIIGVCLLLTISFFSGCVNVPKELTQFSIISFDVEPAIINQGEYANLSWVVMSASLVNIDNGIGNVALNGHRLIQPTQTTTYSLTASNATITKNATATITVKSEENSSEQNQTIIDSIGDVCSVDYLTQQTSVISHNTEIDVYNIDIYKVVYHKNGRNAYLTLQVRGHIENRGKIIDLYNEDSSDGFNYVEYDFQVTTSKHDYTISYVNRTGKICNGIETINLTKGHFIYGGDTLEISFSLKSASETFSKLSVTSIFVKQNLGGGDKAGYVYLSDIAPNPALEVMEAYAKNIGSVGEAIQFNGSIIPITGTPPYEYHWDFGDKGTSWLLNPLHVYTKVGDYTYTFTVTDQAGDTDRETGIITITT